MREAPTLLAYPAVLFLKQVPYIANYLYRRNAPIQEAAPPVPQLLPICAAAQMGAIVHCMIAVAVEGSVEAYLYRRKAPIP